MGDEMGVTLGQIPIMYKGYFDLQKIYKTILKWMDEEHLVYHEKLYKNKPHDGGTREAEIQMVGENEIDLFHKFSMSVDIHAWHVADVQVQQNGKTINTNRGRIEIFINGEIERDWQSMYESSTLYIKLRKLLLKITNNDEDFKYWDTYNQKLLGLQNKLKQVMNIPTTTTIYGENN